MKMTSAYANKMLKQLAEEKEFFVKKEKDSCVYSATVSEEPVIPEYDYTDVSKTIAELDRKIMILKHAINISNVNAVIDICGKTMSIDMILVRMAQLNKRKEMLDFMRKQQPKSRKQPSIYTSRMSEPEYQYINYDLDLVKQEYERISNEIMEIQMSLDKHNQTFEFDVEF